MNDQHLGTIRVTALLVAGLGLLAGCTGDSDADAQDGSAVSSASPSVDVAHLVGSDVPLAAGTYQFAVASPQSSAPDALVAVPEGFVDGGDWYVVSAGGDLFLGLWTAETVEEDACLVPKGDDLTPGPSVEDLAAALVSQKSTDATDPVPVTVDGYDGQYVELTGPSDLGVCDEAPALSEARGIYGGGQVDRLWILDVDGRRVVVDASYAPEASSAERDDLTEMVGSIDFVRAAR